LPRGGFQQNARDFSGFGRWGTWPERHARGDPSRLAGRRGAMYGSPMIRRFVPAASDFRALLELGIPIVIVQVGLMLMGVVDNIFVGHVSGSMLAAVALGNLYFFGLTMPGFGVLLALDPIVAQAVGAKDAPAVA